MYLRTCESFVTKAGVVYALQGFVFWLPLSNHVKRSFLPVPDCIARPIYRTDKARVSLLGPQHATALFAYSLPCRSTGRGKQRMTNT
jgi:hypothetical protein